MSDIVLNKAQRQAVKHGEGPLLVIAGAGTGKTRVITERIVHLVKTKKALSKEILALTFTQKAAQEMEERVDIAMPYGYTDVFISTFHAFCDKVLRQDGIYIGLDPNYVLMTRAQEYLYFRNHLFDFDLKNLRPQGNPTKFLGAILSHFSRLGDENVSPQEYKEFISNSASDYSQEEIENFEELCRVYKQYTDMKFEDSRLSFSDLVPLTIKLLRDNKSVLQRYQERFKYFLVDEFQDTNYAQNQLLTILVPQKGNITVVGDDDQAIYKFRGAAVSNILEFKENYPSCKKVVLVKNYRSCQEILDEAYSLIQNNNPDRLEITEDIDKKLIRVFAESSHDDEVSQLSLPKSEFVDNSDNTSLNHAKAQSKSSSKAKSSKAKSQKETTNTFQTGSEGSDKLQEDLCNHNSIRRIHTKKGLQEADRVVAAIEKLTEQEGLNYSDIAILVRANNHAEPFVDALKYYGIPFHFPGPKGLYSRPEIKDLIAMLRVVVDYQNDAAMYRVLTLSDTESPFNASNTNHPENTNDTAKQVEESEQVEESDTQAQNTQTHTVKTKEIQTKTTRLKASKDTQSQNKSTKSTQTVTTGPSGLTSREFIDVQRLAKEERTSLFELLEEIVGIKVGEKEVGARDVSKREVGAREVGKKDDKSDQDVALNNLRNKESLKKKEELYSKMFSKSSRMWIEKLLSVYDSAFKMVQQKKGVGEILYEMLDKMGVLESLMNKNSIRDEWRIQNISQFFKHLKNFEKEAENGSVFEFVEFLNYAQEIGESPTVDPIDMIDFDAVNITTVHGSKGLEFPAVFLVNLVSSRFPSRNRSDPLPIPEGLIKETLPEGDEHLQEERRLFYVGMTRAKRFLYFTSADFYGDGVRQKKQSVFLHELDLIAQSTDKISHSSIDVENIANIVKGDMEDVLPEDFRKSKLQNIMRNLSYSHISTYDTCPYQFYFKYFLEIPGKESHARSFGMTMHNTLKAFYKRLKMYKQGLPKINKVPTEEDLIDIYKSKWISRGYENNDQEMRRYRSGEKVLSKYYANYFSKEENPIWLEEKFRFDMDEFGFRGVVDRLDRSKEGLILIDYKTGKVPSKEKVKNLQLALYASAIEKIKEESVNGAYLMYLMGPKKVDVPIDDDTKQESEEKALEVLQEIKELNFKPNPSFLCRYCDYRNICDFEQK